MRLGHVSDTHLGYESGSAANPAGHNQRGADAVGAFHAAAKAMIAADVPLVIHSGDMADRPAVPISYQLALHRIVTNLASVRPDGTRRQVVIIAGNHDTSPNARHGCQLNLFSGLPGVHVVTSGFQVIDFSQVPDADPSLSDLLVHALPHDSLKTLDDHVIAPDPSRTNVLVAHGVAGGIEAFIRHQGREYVVPSELLGLDWDYVALGHFHRCGPVSLAGGSAPVANARAWYAGATEHFGFSDAAGALVSGRNWLEVTVTKGSLPAVTRRPFDTRPMVTLPDIDASGCDPASLGACLAVSASTAPAGAVVRQKVTGVSQDVWALVDTGPAKLAAANCLSYSITVRPTMAAAGESVAGDGACALAAALEARLQLIEEPMRPIVRERATTLLRSSLDVYDADEASPADAAPEDPAPPAAPETANADVVTATIGTVADVQASRAAVLAEFNLAPMSSELS